MIDSKEIHRGHRYLRDSWGRGWDGGTTPRDPRMNNGKEFQK